MFTTDVTDVTGYENTYRLMNNEQLLNLAQDRDSLCPEARVAFDSELAKQRLGQKQIDEQAECVRRGQIEDAQRKPLAKTYNGIGTSLYGKRNFGSDGSFTTTVWIVFLWIPLIPLKSVRVKNCGPATPILLGESRSYLVLSESHPDVRQVLNIYLFMLSFFIGAAMLDRIHGGSLVAYATLVVWGCMPWWMRRLARQHGN